MTKRPMFNMAVGLILGILIKASFHWYLIVAAILTELGIAAVFFKERKYFYLMSRSLLFLAMLCFGYFLYQENEQEYRLIKQNAEEGNRIKIQGTIVQREIETEQTTYLLSHCYASLKSGILPCNSIQIKSSKDEYLIGKTLIVTGTIKTWQNAQNEGNFDAEAYYKTKKIPFQLVDCNVEQEMGKADSIAELLDKMKQKLKNIFQSTLSEAHAGIMSTMILGDKSLLDEKIKGSYQTAGISHILAISGLHVSLIGMTFYQLLRKIRVSVGKAVIIGGMTMYFYGKMTGMGISTKRAILMFLLSMLATWIGRSYDSLNALGGSALILLTENPFFLWNAGFLFSFSAVIGVVVVAKIYKKSWEKEKKQENEKESEEERDEKEGKHRKWNLLDKIKKSICETIQVSSCIQLVTTPLNAFFYYEIPIYAVISNGLVLPLIGIVLGCGLAGGIVGFLFLPLAKICFLPCELLLTYCDSICDMCANLPKSVWITGQPDIRILVGYYIVLTVLVLWTKKTKQIRWIGLQIILLCILLFSPKEKGFELDVLSVGQGDGIFLRTQDNICCFFDGGSTDTKQVGTYRILPFLKKKGVGHIAYWFVSHTDEDHISGIREVIECGYPIQNLVFAEKIERDKATVDLLEKAGKEGIQIIYLKKGDCLRTKTAVFTCLFPNEEYDSKDKNALSMVLLYEEAGFRGIFTGDISSEEEKAMLEQNVLKEPVTFYKAAHHGSKSSNHREWLEVLSPSVTAISCGKKNRYGHPSEEAVRNMRECGSNIYDTRESGQITLKRKRGKLLAEEFLKKEKEDGNT